MTPEEIFLAALDQPSTSERDLYVGRSCGFDSALRKEVESLLAAHDRAGEFLARPFIDLSSPAPDSSPAAPQLDRSGTCLGRYQVIRRLGAGGMGEVYLARDTQLERDVAVKLLDPVHTENTIWLARFHREAKAAGGVNHPSILTVYEIGQADGVHFIATEYIRGATLRSWLTSRPARLERVLELAIQIVSALAAAHDAGIIHRDLKPENIMIREDGLIKILDFGLARSPDGPLTPGSSLSDDVRGSRTPQFLTAPGSVIGTIHYMSPEQARGLAVDPRTDIFSFGVVLYELLTGQQPFQGPTNSDVLVSLLDREPPRLVSTDYVMPAELQRIVSKSLRKDRDERFQTARDLLVDLKQVRHDCAYQPGKQTSPPPEICDIPEVRYTCSADVNIAYQVFGHGEIDLVFVMGWVSHLEWFWREPSFARFLNRLGTFARVILFDKRGTGLSDRVPVDQLPTLEQRMDDVRAVMDAVDSQRAVLCGISEGGPMCTLFAATYPEKTMALVMIGSYARRLWAEDYPWGVREEQRHHFFDEIRRTWGGPVGIEDRAPSRAFDPEFRLWWATYLRMGASPGAALALTQMNAQIDIRPILPVIQVPTLVIHRAADRCLKVEEGRFLAEQIPGAKFTELPGEDHLPFVGDQDAILDEIEEFLTGVRHAPSAGRVLATVLAAIPVTRDSGDQSAAAVSGRISRWHSHVQREAELFRGTNITISDDAVLASFDGPTRAIRAALAIRDSARRLGLNVHAGIHIGECDVIAHSIRGTAVDRARGISELAAANDVLVSGTVKDLVAGSGIPFTEQPATDRASRITMGSLYRVDL